MDMLKSVMQLVAACNDRKGVTAAEYAVLAVGIVLVVATAATALGTKLSTVFGQVASAL
jgi:pilus assembly protein Flp/PilA